ncbi:MAG: glycosyltransferase, partial [Pirellulaceae bacterium]
AVSFGPNTWNFRDVVSLLLSQEAAIVVKSAADLESFVRRCLADPTYVREIGTRAQHLVQRQIGASDRTVELLAGLTPGKSLAKAA